MGSGLRRDLTPANAFGITFSTVGVLWVFTRDPLGHALLFGGPVMAVWGWVLASTFNIITALCLAEMAACMPAAIGSLYVFTARLAPWHSKAVATWVNAWANLAGALGATSYYALVTIRTLHSAARLSRVAASPLPYDPADPNYGLTTGQQFGMYSAVLVSWLCLVSAPLSVTAGFITASSLWQILGGGALFSSLLVLSPHRQSVAFVLGRWSTRGDITGINNVPYSVVEGLYFAITAQTGYETVLYFCEEMLVHRRRRGGKGHSGPAQLAPPQGHSGHGKASSGLAPAAGAAGSMSASAALPGSDAANVTFSGAHASGAYASGAAHRSTGHDPHLQRVWAAAAQQKSGGGWRSHSAVPEALFGGLAASCALFLLFLLLLLGAVPSVEHAVDTTNETLGRDPASQIIYDVLKGAYGTGRGSFGLITVLAVGAYGTGLVSAAGTARKLWAMASDGFVPFWLCGVSSSTRVPVRAAAAAMVAMLLPGLLLFVGDWAIDAALSFVPLAINLSYLVPVALRLLPVSSTGYDAATKRVRLSGGFTLGAASRPLFWVSSLWLVFSMVVALSPPSWPILTTTANWAPITTAAMAMFIALSWRLPRWGARRWFRGLASVAGVSYC